MDVRCRSGRLEITSYNYGLAERLVYTVLFAMDRVTLSHPTPYEILLMD